MRPWRDGTGIALLLSVHGCMLGSCAAPEPTKVECSPGDERACPATVDCANRVQHCDDTPPKWSECRCADGPPDAGHPSDGQSPGPELGHPCAVSDDCPEGAFCLSSNATSLFGGGPPSGVCVADCSEDATACQAFARAICVSIGGTGEPPADGGGVALPEAGGGTTALCFEACEVGGQDDPKCALSGAACDVLPGAAAPAAGFCRPLCTTSADCPLGRVCDPRTGVCVGNVASEGPTLGEPCDPTAPSCSGLCVALDVSHAVCSTRCRFGSTEDCAGDADRRGGCLFSTLEGGIGDVGYCAETCGCSADCHGSGTVCDPFNDATLEAAFEALGVCTPVGIALSEPLTCP